MRRLARFAVAAALGGAVLGAPAAASAVLTASTAQTNTFSAGTLSTPGSVQTIHPSVTGSGDGDVRLTWSQSLPRAITYLVQRAPAASPTSWSTVNGTGTSSGTLCTGAVPGTVSCTYDDNAANSTSPPSYNASYTYQVVAKVGGWTQPSTARFAGSLPPTSGSETYLVPPDLYALSGATATSMWAVGANCTVDYYNGSTWTLQTVPTAVCPTGTSLNGVEANAGLPMVVGSGGVTFICTAGCTTAAPTWAAKATPGSPTLYAVSAKAANAMWAVGTNCSLLYYNGTVWTAVTVGPAYCPAGSTLYGVDANGGAPIAAGAAGTLFTCTASCLGTGTPTLTTNTPASLVGTTFYAVSMTSASGVWAVGTGGAIAVCYGTCAGAGATWAAQSSGTTTTLRSVSASANNLVDAVGDGGTILQCTVSCNKTTGYVWTPQPSQTVENLYGVYVVSASQAYVVGANGAAGGAGTGAFAVVLVTALPVNVPTTYSLLGPDVTQLTAPDGALYAAQGALPTTVLPTTCTAPTPGLRVRPASTVPAGSWPLGKAVATIVLQVDDVPSGGAGFQLLVSADNGSSWTSYPVTAPTAAGTPTTSSVDVTGALASTAAIASTQLCLQGTSGTGPLLRPSVDVLHLDVN